VRLDKRHRHDDRRYLVTYALGQAAVGLVETVDFNICSKSFFRGCSTQRTSLPIRSLRALQYVKVMQ
jgi:hypothetical protein